MRAAAGVWRAGNRLLAQRAHLERELERGFESAGSEARSAKTADTIDLKVSPVGMLVAGRLLRTCEPALRARAAPACPQAGFS